MFYECVVQYKPLYYELQVVYNYVYSSLVNRFVLHIRTSTFRASSSCHHAGFSCKYSLQDRLNVSTEAVHPYVETF